MATRSPAPGAPRNARSMSTTCIQRAPASTMARAPSTGAPPNASIGCGPSGVHTARRPSATSIAGSTVNTTRTIPRESREPVSGRAALRRRSGWDSCSRRAAPEPSKPRSSSRSAPLGSTANVPRLRGVTPWEERKRRRTGAAPGCAVKSSRRRSRTTGVHAAAGRSTTRAAATTRRSERPRSGSRTSFALIWSSRPRRSIRPVTRTIRSVSRRIGHGLVDARERHDLDTAREPLQPELRVGITLLRVLARERSDRSRRP